MKHTTQTKKQFALLGLMGLALVLAPELAHAGLDDSLRNIQHRLTDVILPILAVIGMAIAAISFFTGHPNAKTHVTYAVLGCVFGFGAQAIVNFIAQAVH